MKCDVLLLLLRNLLHQLLLRSHQLLGKCGQSFRVQFEVERLGQALKSFNQCTLEQIRHGVTRNKVPKNTRVDNEGGTPPETYLHG